MKILFSFDEELELLRVSVETFALEQIAPRAAAIDKDYEFTRGLWPKLGKLFGEMH